MDDKVFNQIYNILEESFKPYLHRGYKNQKLLLANEKYNIITHIEKEEVLGFLSYFEIEKNLIFIEHFAVKEDCRGRGIGKKIFNKIMNKSGIKILEVEPPINKINNERIKLYENFGFILNKTEYYQPPYNQGDSKTQLNIMSTKKLDQPDFEKITEKIYSIVYSKN